jgi:hypothetical protein
VYYWRSTSWFWIVPGAVAMVERHYCWHHWRFSCSSGFDSKICELKNFHVCPWAGRATTLCWCGQKKVANCSYRTCFKHSDAQVSNRRIVSIGTQSV